MQIMPSLFSWGCVYKQLYYKYLEKVLVYVQNVNNGHLSVGKLLNIYFLHYILYIF